MIVQSLRYSFIGFAFVAILIRAYPSNLIFIVEVEVMVLFISHTSSPMIDISYRNGP